MTLQEIVRSPSAGRLRSGGTALIIFQRLSYLLRDEYSKVKECYYIYVK